MLRPLHDPTYRRLYLAQVVALLGTGIATVALGLLAYDLRPHEAGRILGTALAVKMVAYVAVAPVATALLARRATRRVLVGADLVRLAAAAALPFVSAQWHIYVLIFVLQAASATFTPTFQALIPRVLADEEVYTQALSLSRLAYDLEAVISPVFAAALLTLVTAPTLFLGTAASFAISALIILATRLPSPGAPSEPDDEAPLLSLSLAGIALMGRTPALRPVLAINLAVAAAGAYVLVLTVVIVRDHFGLPEDAVAWMLAANGLGSMAGALLLPRWLRRLPERPLMLGGGVALAVASAAVPVTLHGAAWWGVPVLAALWLAIGLAWACAETPVARLIRRHVDPDELPCAFAAQFSLSHACWLVTYPLVGWLGTASLGGAAVAMAAVAALATTLGALLWPRATSRRPARLSQ